MRNRHMMRITAPIVILTFLITGCYASRVVNQSYEPGKPLDENVVKTEKIVDYEISLLSNSKVKIQRKEAVCETIKTTHEKITITNKVTIAPTSLSIFMPILLAPITLGLSIPIWYAYEIDYTRRSLDVCMARKNHSIVETKFAAYTCNLITNRSLSDDVLTVNSYRIISNTITPVHDGFITARINDKHNISLPISNEGIAILDITQLPDLVKIKGDVDIVYSYQNATISARIPRPEVKELGINRD